MIISAIVGLLVLSALVILAYYMSRPRANLPICSEPDTWYGIAKEQREKAGRKLTEYGNNQQGLRVAAGQGHSAWVTCSSDLSAKDIADNGVLVQLPATLLGLSFVSDDDICVAVQTDSDTTGTTKRAIVACPSQTVHTS